MRLLFITRKIDSDDGRAGFICAWLKKMSQKVDQLTVICQEKGDISGLEGMNIYSLGKEKILNYPHIFQRLAYALKFYGYIWKLRNKYDGVFVHMHTIYALLGFPVWKLLNKKIGLWYAHVRTSSMAKISSYLVDYIFSPSGESFKFAKHKLKETNHGVDTEVFKPINKEKTGKWKIVSVGRISLVKEYEVLMEAINILVNKYGVNNFEIDMIGQPANKEDFSYFEELKTKIKKYRLEKYFNWRGDIANKDVYRFYQNGDVFVNMQPGGGFGKAVLEAMATGLICVLATSAYDDMLGRYKKETIFEPKNPKDMADKFSLIFKWSDEKTEDYKKLARDYVVKNHNLDNLMDKIISAYK
jgi:glycosyltransferase involved in cell wall biosynthesis